MTPEISKSAERAKRWRQNNPSRLWWKLQPDRGRKYSEKRRRVKGDHVKRLARAWWAKQALACSDTWVAKNLRTRIYLAVKRGQRAGSLPELLGCSIPELRQHLEAQFKPGMSWGNYGEWHVDHIRPCVSFDLSKPEEQRACFHYTNLQPLWGMRTLLKAVAVCNSDDAEHLHIR